MIVSNDDRSLVLLPFPPQFYRALSQLEILGCVRHFLRKATLHLS